MLLSPPGKSMILYLPVSSFLITSARPLYHARGNSPRFWDVDAGVFGRGAWAFLSSHTHHSPGTSSVISAAGDYDPRSFGARDISGKAKDPHVSQGFWVVLFLPPPSLPLPVLWWKPVIARGLLALSLLPC